VEADSGATSDTSFLEQLMRNARQRALVESILKRISRREEHGPSPL
jgi:hypothetical protein